MSKKSKRDPMIKIILQTLAVVSSLLIGVSGHTAVEKDLVGKLNVAGRPIDSVVSGDGKLLFVLTADSKVHIYEKTGVAKDTLSVEGNPEMIAVSPTGDILYLTDKETGATDIVSVNFIQRISETGNAFRGPENAPVVVAIFSDFQ